MATTWSPGQTRLTLLDEHALPTFPSEDVRGLEVRDASNARIGTVEGLVVDTSVGRVRLLQVGGGGVLGFGRHHWLVPVDVVNDVTTEHVFLDTSRDRLADAPERSTVEDEAQLAEVYAFYGRQPFWSEGYRHPDWTSME
jgi:sporulation protein YlmC with PRC-barrel domain